MNSTVTKEPTEQEKLLAHFEPDLYDWIPKAGDEMTVIPQEEVTQRLIEVWGTEWSMELRDMREFTKQRVLPKGEIVELKTFACLVRLTSPSGAYRDDWGWAEEKISSKTDQVVGDLGDVLLSAMSIALKRAAARFGVGLHIYRDAGALKRKTKEAERKTSRADHGGNGRNRAQNQGAKAVPHRLEGAPANDKQVRHINTLVDWARQHKTKDFCLSQLGLDGITTDDPADLSSEQADAVISGIKAAYDLK